MTPLCCSHRWERGEESERCTVCDSTETEKEGKDGCGSEREVKLQLFMDRIWDKKMMLFCV